MNKRIILILILATATSCTTTITSPATGIQYTGRINVEGIAVVIKPPFWEWAVNTWQWLTD